MLEERIGAHGAEDKHVDIYRKIRLGVT